MGTANSCVYGKYIAGAELGVFIPMQWRVMTDLNVCDFKLLFLCILQEVVEGYFRLVVFDIDIKIFRAFAHPGTHPS